LYFFRYLEVCTGALACFASPAWAAGAFFIIATSVKLKVSEIELYIKRNRKQYKQTTLLDSSARSKKEYQTTGDKPKAGKYIEDTQS
jgi:hypothetical protein